MRWRIEAEGGVVAGSGAALYWAAERLPRRDETPADAWLREAMRQPLRQLLAQAAASPATVARVQAWVCAGDTPSRTFLHDRGDVPSAARDHFEVIQDQPAILLGNAIELGVVTPLLQVQRMLQDAAKVAWQIALLYAQREERLRR